MLVSLADLLEVAKYEKPKIKTKGRKPYKAPTAKKKPADRAKNVGALIRHCMVALAREKKNKFGGFTSKGAKAAWNVCRWAMTKYGFMKGPYRKDAPPTKANTKMTQKGSKRNMKHAQGACPRYQNTPERKALAKKELPLKQRLFKRLFKYIDK